MTTRCIALPDADGAEAACGPFASPFDELGPPAIARRAAALLQADLAAGMDGAGLRAGAFDDPGTGKMFGVLVVRAADGSLGYLRAFSGTLHGHFYVPGFAPPVFDRAERNAVEIEGERIVSGMTARAVGFAQSDEVNGARDAAAAVASRCLGERAMQREQHAERRHARHRARKLLEDSACAETARAALLADLASQSRADKAQKRRLDVLLQAERHQVEVRLAKTERRLRALSRLHRMVSRRLMKRIHDTYRIVNARGEEKPLRELFAPVEPPGGAGDCAGPKLIAYAYANGLVPVAMAEFWWGPPPPAGGRAAGAFYPACREKCGAILPFMLEGLHVAEPRRFAPRPSAHLEMAEFYEDEWIVVVGKPEGLLSVPGKGQAAQDSVLTRLRSQYPEAGGPLLVHRLDLDTSGLLLAAKDPAVHAALQKQFLERSIGKTYVAVVDGPIAEDFGLIELPLRGDLNDRPRQVFDLENSKKAVTEWMVVERLQDGRTRMRLTPHTGRTHQLRVHTAHPLGLGVPIAGDRLYGLEHSAPRLMLHAETLCFTHPHTGSRVLVTWPAPF